MNRFVIAEPDKCIGCRTCEIACVVAHPTGLGNELSPENFYPRLKVIKGPVFSAPVQCHHCDNAPCVNSCPTNALVFKDRTVQLVEDRCIGCQNCVLACPFGAMQLVPKKVNQAALGPKTVKQTSRISHKCDLCYNVAEGPQCVKVCPTNALHLVDTQNLTDSIDKKREQSLAALPVNTGL